MIKQNYETLNETTFTKELENGLTVILLPRKEMEKTYAVFATDYGSIDQTFIPLGGDKEIKVPEGIAHFLEHKLFEKEDGDVFQDFGKQGASANAFTSFTTTAYLFSATDNIIENTRTLIDFVQDPYFTEASVEKEKGIIEQEITMYDDEPDWRSFMGTIKAMFESHPVNVDIAGTVESIQDITKDDLYTCYNTFYHPSNMTLFIAGNFSVEEMMKMIEENQGNKTFAKPEEIIRNYPEELDKVHEVETTIPMNVTVPKSTVGIKENVAFDSPEELLKADILLDMVMDFFYSKGGLYYRELYESSLIDSSFYFDTTIEKNFAYSMIGSNTEDVTRFSSVVKDQLLKTKDFTFKEIQFEKLKKKKIGQMLRGMNSLEFIANQFVHYHALGANLFNVIPIIESLTLKDINEFLRNWIREERLSTCNIVPENAS